MTQKGFAILEMSVVMLIILVSIGVYTYTQKNNSSDQSITLSPTPSTNVDTTLSTFDYTYKVPENLSKEAAPQSQPRCWTHIDTAAPVTHQEITDLCVKTWKNSGEYLDGLQWIENSSEIAGFLQLANTNEYYGDITWSEKTSPVGSWYLSNQFVDLIGETPRYYAFLYGDTIVQIDSLDRDTLEEVVNSFNHVWQIYTNTEHNFTIQYPQSTLINKTKNIFEGFIWNGEYPLGSAIVVDILYNPDHLSLELLGDKTYGEPLSLSWSKTTFAAQSAITTQFEPPGDSGTMTIYLFEYDDKAYAVWKTKVDKPNSSYYEDLSNEVLNSFKLSK